MTEQANTAYLTFVEHNFCRTATKGNSNIVISTEGRDLMQEKNYYVYFITNWNSKVMYIGMTNDLKRRMYEHKNKIIKGFTEKYNVNRLVYFESTTDVNSAIAREKEVKKWRREKKNALVIQMNPEWKDLSVEL
jgi:putative endonuclease